MRPKPPNLSTQVSVETHPGYKGEPTPRAFTHDGNRLEVLEVAAHWETERHSIFKVRASDRHHYTIRQHIEDLTWELVMREG